MNTFGRFGTLGSFVLVWCGLVYGSAKLYTLDLPIKECSICGPWGCGPPLDALIGAHALWTSLLAPLAGLVCRMLAGTAGRRLAKWLLAAGGVVLVGLFSVAALTWLRSHGAEHAVQRGLFVVAITPDAMGLPLLAGGAFGWLAARKPIHTAADQQQPVETGATGRENLAV